MLLLVRRMGASDYITAVLTDKLANQIIHILSWECKKQAGNNIEQEKLNRELRSQMVDPQKCGFMNCVASISLLYYRM